MPTSPRDIVENVVAKDSTKQGTTSAGKNFDDLKRKVDSVSKSGDSFGKKLKGALSGLKAPLGVATAAFGGLAVQAGKNASDAQQSLGATQQIFGKTADQIIKKSNEAATKYGLSANDYRESANLIGSLFKNQGVASNQLAGQTDSLIGKASDLSAVFGGTTADAVDALSSAFKGEFDPLEKYGISLNQTAINTEAMRVAHVKTTAAFNKLSPAAQKAAQRQATLNLINKQSSDTTGQFAAQTNTSAEKLQIVKAKYENLSATLGAKLLPVFNKLLTYGEKLINWAGKNKVVVGAIAALVAVVWLLNAAMDANPIVLIVLGIGALIVAVIYCYNHFKTFRDIVNGVWGFLKGVGAWFAGPFVDFFKGVGAWFAGPFAGFFKTAFNDIKGVVETVGNAFKTAWNAVWGFFKNIGAWFAGPFVNFFKKGYEGVKNGVTDAKNWVVGKFNDVVGFVKGLPGKIKSAASGMWDGIKDAFRGAINWIIRKWNDLSFTLPSVDTHIPGVGRVGGWTLSTPNIPTFSAGTSWAPVSTSDNRGTVQPPTPVQVENNMTVNIDGLRVMVERTVDKALERQAWRVRMAR